MYYPRVIAFLLATSSFLGSCKSDEDEGPVIEPIQSGKWEFVNDTSFPVSLGSRLVVLDNAIYEGLGYYTTGGGTNSQFTDLGKFDQATELWVSMNPYPTSNTMNTFAFGLNSKIYAGAGMHPKGLNVTQEVYEYDPASNNWSAKSNIPILGTQWFGFNFQHKGYAYALNKDVMEYHQDTDTWTASDLFPDRPIQSGFAINGKEYVLTWDKLWEYNPQNQTWAAKANYPSAMSFDLFAFMLKDEIYVHSGSKFNKYNALEDRWIEQPAFPKSFPGVSSTVHGFNVGNVGYVSLVDINEQGEPRNQLYRFVLPE